MLSLAGTLYLNIFHISTSGGTHSYVFTFGRAKFRIFIGLMRVRAEGFSSGTILINGAAINVHTSQNGRKLTDRYLYTFNKAAVNLPSTMKWYYPSFVVGLC